MYSALKHINVSSFINATRLRTNDVTTNGDNFPKSSVMLFRSDTLFHLNVNVSVTMASSTAVATAYMFTDAFIIDK